MLEVVVFACLCFLLLILLIFYIIFFVFSSSMVLNENDKTNNQDSDFMLIYSLAVSFSLSLILSHI